MRGPQSSSDAACARQRREAMVRDRTLLYLNASQPLRTQARPIPDKSARMLFNTKSRDHSILRSEIDIVVINVIIIVFHRYLSGCFLISKLLQGLQLKV